MRRVGLVMVWGMVAGQGWGKASYAYLALSALADSFPRVVPRLHQTTSERVARVYI